VEEDGDAQTKMSPDVPDVSWVCARCRFPAVVPNSTPGCTRQSHRRLRCLRPADRLRDAPLAC